MNLHLLSGIAAAGITGLGFWSYLKAIKSDNTLPNWTTWFVWWVENAIILLTSRVGGAWETIFGTFVAEIGYSIILILLRKQKREWHMLDKCCLVIAIIVSPGVWYYSGDPLFALGLTLIVDFVGAIPTIVQAIKKPESEDKRGWALFAFASFMGILAIDQWNDLHITVYPLYLSGVNGFIAFLVWLPRRKARQG